jgi:hypothetical protein
LHPQLLDVCSLVFSWPGFEMESNKYQNEKKKEEEREKRRMPRERIQ